MSDLARRSKKAIADLEKMLEENQAAKFNVSEYLLYEDKIEDLRLKSILRNIFNPEKVDNLSKEDIFECIAELKEYIVTESDKDAIDDIFECFANYHYRHNVYGFMVFLGISGLYVADVDKSGYVYICKSDIGLHKIGYSKEPKQRMKALGLGSSIKHEAIYVIKTDNMSSLESELHKQFDDKRKHSEWFDLDSDDLKIIKKCHPMGFSPKWTKG